MIETRLAEIKEQLNESYKVVADLKKIKQVPSPGLLAQIKYTEKKRDTFMDSFELWKTIQKVYPNYDR